MTCVSTSIPGKSWTVNEADVEVMWVEHPLLFVALYTSQYTSPSEVTGSDARMVLDLTQDLAESVETGAT